MTPDYALALTTGLLGGFGHCVAMCGPVVAGFALRPGAGASARSQLFYHSGRLATYAFLGTVMGIGGSFANTAGRLVGLQNVASLLAGATMLVLGLATLWRPRAAREAPPSPQGRRRLPRRLLDPGPPEALLPLGLLLGLVPCGLSSTALLMAAATASPARGFLVALLFGLGTVPALALFGVFAGRLAAGTSGALRRIGGAAVAAMGLLWIQRGIAAHGGL